MSESIAVPFDEGEELLLNKQEFKNIINNWRDGVTSSEETMKILYDLCDIPPAPPLFFNPMVGSVVKAPVVYPFNCPSCMAGFNDLISLNDHILCLHDNVFAMNHYCDLCDAEFSSEVELANHLRGHSFSRRGRRVVAEAPAPEIQGTVSPIALGERVMNIFGRIGGKLFGGAMPSPEMPQTPPHPAPKAEWFRRDSLYYQELKISSEATKEDAAAEIDDIQTNSRGRHCCVICRKKYLSAHLLGAHFMITHGKYDRMLELDDNIQKIGFPGFDILEHIGMISRNPSRAVVLEGKGAVCKICQEKYVRVSKKESVVELDYDSDTEVMYQKKIPSVKTKVKVQDDLILSFRTDLAGFNIMDFVKYPELVDVIKKYEALVRIPIIMSCCEEHLCTECLENTLANSALLSCPFCYVDHTKYDQDYIKIYEIGKINPIPCQIPSTSLHKRSISKYRNFPNFLLF
ncbi:MAG: procyclic acidic repetitive protein PARP [Harvfovirus sp.]|uniref:Procyclic acidic repetitive protein PARP n=1 Tax=Harvfovirus sp. TaxID=2487768 RepID=A0A3G5A436_9VIRU|nr:MAG: procyclic acidic repetitive protein PARP [Harvfovirus sp.]